MKLQFLIPRHNESEKILKPLLDSIAIQQNVDFNEIGAIICDDGSNTKLSNDFLNYYPFVIQNINISHQGVSAARQACLDKATAEYVMFCDCDDMFFNACGLYLIFREMDNGEFDLFVSTFIEETRLPNGSPIYVNHTKDSTFVHGKIFRLNFLKESDIKWKSELQVHEDSYFVNMAYACLKDQKRGRYCNTSFYLWKWNSDSTCRHDDEYILKTYNNMIDSNTALVTDLLERGMEDKARFYCINLVFDAYFTLNKDEWINQENQNYRYKVEQRFKVYYQTFKNLFDSGTEKEKNSISNTIRNRMVKEGMPLESICFSDWIKEIEEGIS